MWIRMRLDVGWRDLVAGVVSCFLPGRRSIALHQARSSWNCKEPFLITLSVRSAFDLTLRALQLPEGSEVLLSALTVPDMVRIVAAHGLVPVPLDVDERGEIISASLIAAITPKTRMIVIAHLFGACATIDEVLRIARSRNLLVVEDFAQTFRFVGDSGHPESDIAMFSFGPIKTASAMGGAVVRVKSCELCAKMAELLKTDPIQSSIAFARRLVRFAVLKALSGERRATLVRNCVEMLGYEFDAIANSVTRGFSRSNLLVQLRKQPSTPLLRLLLRRWQTYDFRRIERRVQMGKRLDSQLGCWRAPSHTYWIYPLVVDSPVALRERLRMAGFDVTSLARMTVVPPVDDYRIPTTARRTWEHFVVLPWYPEIPDDTVDSMFAIIESLKATEVA